MVEIIRASNLKNVIATSTTTLKKLAYDQCGLDQTELRELLDLGAVYIREERLSEESRTSASIRKGDRLRIHLKPKRFDVSNLQAKQLILFENADFLIVNKPCGVPVQATRDNAFENLLHWLKLNWTPKVYVVHELDMGASGLVVLAKTKEFQTFLQQQILSGSVKKVYRALVQGLFQKESGVLTHFMEPSDLVPKKMSAYAKSGWQKCSLEILDVQISRDRTSELSLQLITGRTHQIRAQLASVGHAICGDHLYGYKGQDSSSQLSLQASFLSFQDQKSETFYFKLAEKPWDVNSVKSVFIPQT